MQNLLSKTNGKIVGDLMTPAPVVVRESTNLEDAARFWPLCFILAYHSSFFSSMLNKLGTTKLKMYFLVACQNTTRDKVSPPACGGW